MSLHIWHHQGPHKPSSSATFILNSRWGRAATGKKKKKILHLSMHTGSLHDVMNMTFNSLYPEDCGLPGFSVMEGSILQETILEHIGQY